jgi:hypothetical protein
MIALMTGVFAPARGNSGGPPPIGLITIQKVGLFTAILMRWSQLANDLAERPSLLDEVLAGESATQSVVVAKWAKDHEFLKAIELDGEYSLLKVDLRPLLMIMPDAYSGSLGARDATRVRTQLVAQQLGRNAPSANTSPTFVDKSSGPSGPAGAPDTTTRGATGATGSSDTIIGLDLSGSGPTPSA